MGSKQKKPNQINYLNRRLLGSTVIRLFVFTVAFMLLFVLFDNTISNQLGTWIADNTELVAYLAHDIRTPLTSVIGYLQLLSEDDNVDEEKRAKYLKIALDKADSLSYLIEELFDITRLNLSSLSLDYEDLDIYLLSAQVIDELYPQANDRDIVFDIGLDEASPQDPECLIVHADGVKIARAIRNVMRNAIAYADPGSTIVVRCSVDENKRTVSVANRGDTIPADKLPRLFEKFYREDNARSTSSRGAGLGLAIACEIVEAHKGSITAESAEGLTTFSITLPAPSQDRA